MSDFPKGGDIASTRAWLDKKGFVGFFDGWKADAILGLSEEKIMGKVTGERAEMLWGLLNTARQTTCKRTTILPIYLLISVFFIISRFPEGIRRFPDAIYAARIRNQTEGRFQGRNS
jgi:hypothetical protein